MSDDLFRRFQGAPGTPAKPAAPAGSGQPAPTAPPARPAAPRPQASSGRLAAVQDDSGLAFRGAGPAVRLAEADVQAAIAKIPSMPTVVQQLLRRTGSTAGTTGDLEDLIKQDMGIAGRVLKLVNSPFYGLGQKVSSIKAAVDIIGLASLKSIAVAASTASILATRLDVYGYADQGLWVNACATAAVARTIGLKAGVNRDQVEEYFCAGLLRDIGMLVLGPFLAAHHKPLRREPGGEQDIIRRERSLIGVDHCWCGERVAEKWSLPEDLKVVIGHHHRIPPAADVDTLRKLASVRLAERLTYTMNVGLLPDHPFERQIDGILVSATGMAGPRLEELMKELPQIIANSEIGT